MRICLVYDCLFPHTVGGAERWYRNLAEALAADGHDVTYLTLRQWERGERPDLDGHRGAGTGLSGRVRVVTAGPRMALYTESGRRRIAPPLVFGVGVLWHLLRHGRRYDVVHTCSFPYFSLLAAALARPLGRYGLVVDWFEVWSRGYWRDYLGGVGGRVGALVQRLCAAVGQRAFCFSALHARRLREAGLRGPVTVLRGLYAGPDAPIAEHGAGGRAARGDGAGGEADRGDGPPADERDAPGEPLVVFAGRLIPEKRAPLGVAAVAAATDRIPGLRAVFYGDGPERAELDGAIARLGVRDVVSAPGFVDAAEIDAAQRRALCVLLPSRREGYGLVVVEAAARGTPSVVVAGEDNAAVELVEDGVNGVVARDESPAAIAAAIVRVHREGAALRERTARWFAENAQRLSLASSLRAVLAVYAGGQAPGASPPGGAPGPSNGGGDAPVAATPPHEGGTSLNPNACA